MGWTVRRAGVPAVPGVEHPVEGGIEGLLLGLIRDSAQGDASFGLNKGGMKIVGVCGMHSRLRNGASGWRYSALFNKHKPIRTMKTSLALLAAATAFLGSSCQNYGPNANRGAATGALIGAGAGAIIGNQSGRALEGAAIGAAAGGIAGGAYGNARDQEQRGY